MVVQVRLIEIGIGHEERVDVPEGQREVADHLADQLDGEAALVAGRRSGIEIPAERVSAVDLDDIPGVDDVAEALGHFLAVAIEDEAQADDVLIGDRVHEERADGMQGVEPAAGLIDRLADVVGGELRLELFLVLEGIVPLGVGHGTGVKPDIDQIRGRGPSARRTRGRDT